MAVQVHDDRQRRRYEMLEDGMVVGYATYRLHQGMLEIIHTEIDPTRSGRGLGGQLVSSVLDDARSRGLGVLPYCPYVRHYIDDHAEQFLDLVPADRRKEFGWVG